MSTHDDLLDNLAAAKNSIYKNINLGSKFLNMYENCRYLPKADLVVVHPSYTRFCIDIYEVKSNRSDFLSDIRTGKWRKYLPFCHRFYFACLRGIINIKEIPPEAGLLLFNPEKKTWWTRRAGLERKIEIDLEMLQALIFYKQKGGDKQYWRQKAAKIGKIRSVYHFELEAFGKEVAEAVSHYRCCGEVE